MVSTKKCPGPHLRSKPLSSSSVWLPSLRQRCVVLENGLRIEVTEGSYSTVGTKMRYSCASVRTRSCITYLTEHMSILARQLHVCCAPRQIPLLYLWYVQFGCPKRRPAPPGKVRLLALVDARTTPASIARTKIKPPHAAELARCISVLQTDK